MSKQDKINYIKERYEKFQYGVGQADRDIKFLIEEIDQLRALLKEMGDACAYLLGDFTTKRTEAESRGLRGVNLNYTQIIAIADALAKLKAFEIGK